MSRPLHRWLALCALAAAACSSDSNGVPAIDIRGGWKLVEHLALTSPPGVVCDDTVRVAVEQHGSAFSAFGSETGVCRSAAPYLSSNAGPVAAVDGQIGPDSAVRFSFGACVYQGTIATGDAAIDGATQCSGTDRVGTGTWHMVPSDILPPSVSTALGPGQYAQGDTLVVTVSAADSALAWVGDSVSFDAVNYAVDCPQSLPPVRDSVTVSGTGGQHVFRAAVPWCAWYGHVIGIAQDTAGNRSEQELATFPIVLPVSQVSATFNDSIYTLGDTVHIHVAATNQRGLSYIGYRYTWDSQLYDGSDSVAVSGTSAQHDFTLALPAVAQSSLLYVTPVARHELGWLTQADYVTARLTDAVILPVARLTLPGKPNDIAYAALTDQVYLTDTGHSTVLQVGLAPLALGTSWTIPARGASLDLSGSEDSLLVALRGQLALAVVRVSTGVAQTVALTPPDSIDIYDARHLRVVGNGRALVLIGSGSAGSIVQLDLGSGAQQRRVTWSGYGTLERSADRARLLLIDGGSPVGDQLYVAASDTFLPDQRGVVSLFGSNAQVSADDPVTQWLVGCQLLTRDMVSIRMLSDPSLSFGPTALARDGARAYCPRNDGVVEFDVASGNRLRAIWLPRQPEFLKALPGHRLLATSGNEMYLLSLP
jgi:hypothetical protein